MMTPRKQILLVEDNPGDAELISEMIGSNEPDMFDIHVDSRLSHALDTLSKGNIDIVLLDLGLPDSSGLDALKVVKATHPGLPVVVITGNDDEKTGARAVKSGAQDYILKGMVPAHYLLQALKYAIYRQESEFRLKQSEEKYRNIVENIGIGVALIDPDMTILETNEKFRQWFPELSLKRPLKCYEAITGPCMGKPVHPDCPVVKTLSDGQSHKGISRSGSATYRFLSFPLKNDRARIKGAILLKEDISERVSMEARLRQAQKMESLGTLAGGIAHDFNNILTAIRGFATLARNDAAEGSAVADDLDEILKAAYRATDLVKQILTFSRKVETQKKPVRMDLIVKEALKLLRPTLPSNIEIRSSLGREGDMVIADSTQVHQIIMNLCTNAAHAMERTGGMLEVVISRTRINEGKRTGFPKLAPGPYLRLKVSDTGCGIPPDIMDSIFDPYFTTKCLGSGTGLGLSVVQGIIRDCGGDIRVESVPGSGSTFTLFFPAVKIETPEVSRSIPEADHRGKEHILLVDDEPTILKVGRRFLSRYGYRVHTASNGEDAWDYIRQHPDGVDMVVSDMTMPKTTGLDLAKQVKESRPDIPVIIMTGYSRMLSPGRCEKYGIRAVLNKPLSSENLVGEVRKIFDRTGSAKQKSNG
ncbi:MAG: response regulator [Desulfobacter sp.]